MRRTVVLVVLAFLLVTPTALAKSQAKLNGIPITKLNDPRVGWSKAELRAQRRHSGDVVAFFQKRSYMLSWCRTRSAVLRRTCDHARGTLQGHRWLQDLAADRLKAVAAKERRDAQRAAQRAREARTQASSGYGSGSSICGSSCIQCESGGNPGAVSPDGVYWGLYQFDYGTWVAHGGGGSEYGHAGAARQHQVASRIRYDAWPNC